jgi:hypothetical protein
MLEVSDLKGENIIWLKVSGGFTTDEVKDALAFAEEKLRDFPRIKLFYEVRDLDLRDITFDLIYEEFSFLFRHPHIITNIEKAALVSDQGWLRKMFAVEMALIPTIEAEAFPVSEKDEALDWLRADHREASRMDLVFSEFLEYGTLKAVGGFAIGLIAADLFSSPTRKKTGLAMLAGGILVGLPLALRVLNNNRKLLP